MTGSFCALEDSNSHRQRNTTACQTVNEKQPEAQDQICRPPVSFVPLKAGV